MGTSHLRRLRKRDDRSDPVAAGRARRWALIGLLIFLGCGCVGLSLMVIGLGVPGSAWGPR